MNKDIIDRVAAAAGAEGLDAVVALSPENFAYLAGFVVPSHPLLRWRHAGACVTADGRSALLSVDMEASTVRSWEPEAEVRVWQEFEDNAMAVLSELLGDLGLTAGRIGVETDYLPARDLERLRERLPGARWEPAQGILNRLRMTKTPREVDLMRRLARLTDRAIRDGYAAVHPGDTEMDLAGAVVANLYRLGAESFRLLIVASGERSQYPNVGPTDRALTPGDLVRVEVFGMIGGYHAGVCRTAVVGQGPPEAPRIWSHMVECQRLNLELIRPGASSGEVYRRFTEAFTAHGYEPISFVGHGIGLYLHEEPYLGAFGHWELEEGMVLGVEPVLFVPGRYGLQLKDMVAVTAEGSELLSDVTDTTELLVVE